MSFSFFLFLIRRWIGTISFQLSRVLITDSRRHVCTSTLFYLQLLSSCCCCFTMLINSINKQQHNFLFTIFFFFFKRIICPVHLALKRILGKSSGSARLLLKLLASHSGNNSSTSSDWCYRIIFFIYQVLVYLCVCFNSFSFSIAVEMSLHYKCFKLYTFSMICAFFLPSLKNINVRNKLI